MNNYSAFSYKAGHSVFHRMSAWCKILLIPVFNIAVFSLNWKFAAVFVGIQFITFFCLRFTLKEQLTDLTPVLWYGIFMYLIDLISGTYIGFAELGLADSFLSALKKCLYDEKTFSTIVKFFVCNQSAALMFKTSTSLELREGIETIELKIRKVLPCSKKPRFAIVVSMFINFIPAVFKIWNQLKRAWFARGGKYNLRMFLTLFPVLFSIGLKYAFDTTKAVLIRE